MICRAAWYIPFGDGEDYRTEWVALNKATDDQVRFHLALIHARNPSLARREAELEELVRAGVLEVTQWDEYGNPRTYSDPTKPKKQGGA